MTEEQKKEMRRQFASSGGKAFRDKYGKKGYQSIAEKSHASIKKNKPDFYSHFSKAGVHARQVKSQARIAESIGDIDTNSTLKTFISFLSRGK
jgi:hypothetical protein